MSPRNKFMMALLSVFFCILVPGISTGQDKNVVIQFYQDHISVVDGNRCTMTPSCSAYAARAFEKHGPVMGWIMSCDRLLRCGRDEVTISPSRPVNGISHTYDPIEANDFWWFDTPKQPNGTLK